MSDKRTISGELTASEKLRTVPLLGALAAMIAGIAAGMHLARVPLYVWVVSAAVCGAAAWVAAATGDGRGRAGYGRTGSGRAGKVGLPSLAEGVDDHDGTTGGFGRAMVVIDVALAVAFFGATLARLHTPVAVVPQGERVWLRMVTDDAPLHREGRRSAQTTGRVTEWQPDDPSSAFPSGEWLRGGDRLIINVDTVWSLGAGDRVTFRGYVNPTGGDMAAGSDSAKADGSTAGGTASGANSESSYGRLMRARGYVGRTYISRYSRPVATPTVVRSPRTWAKRLQTAATQRLGRLSTTGAQRRATASGGKAAANGTLDDAIAVAAAMTTGDRGGITPELRRAYSRTGASHLLAVSGLHVGIVFLIINVLLYALPLVRGGHIAKNVLAAAAVWGYAALTGLSPSATRAAFMFTGAQAALATSRARNPANVMCATAMVMLAARPGLVADVSFQLSFVAVTAILAWFGPVYRLAAGRYGILNALWAMLAVGFVASTATMPIVSRTFGVFSPAGVVLNPLVITTAHLTVAASLVWIAAPLPALEPLFRWLVGGPAWLQNRAVELVGAVPDAAVDWRMPLWAVWAIYALAAAATAWYHLSPRRSEPFRLSR